MIQEIITYMVIGSALTLVAMRVIKQVAPKKKKQNGTAENSVPAGHNCSECSAECQLRDLPKYVIEKNLDECVQVEKKSKLLQS